MILDIAQKDLWKSNFATLQPQDTPWSIVKTSFLTLTVVPLSLNVLYPTLLYSPKNSGPKKGEYYFVPVETITLLPLGALVPLKYWFWEYFASVSEAAAMPMSSSVDVLDTTAVAIDPGL